MPRNHPCRIAGIFSREANTATIFRRGPTNLTQMLNWDLNTDVITSGQWLGGKVFVRRCDVSPNGRYAVVFATNYTDRLKRGNPPSEKSGGEDYAWTAICRPPYFHAIALWYTGGSYDGGGLWKSNDDLRLNYFHSWTEAIPAAKIRVGRLMPWSIGDQGICTARMLSDGWISTQEGPAPEEAILTKSFDTGQLRRDSVGQTYRWTLRDLDGVQHGEWVEGNFETRWIDIDSAGRVVFGDRGCLWAWSDFPRGAPQLIADLNGNHYEDVATPEWATQW